MLFEPSGSICVFMARRAGRGAGPSDFRFQRQILFAFKIPSQTMSFAPAYKSVNFAPYIIQWSRKQIKNTLSR